MSSGLGGRSRWGTRVGGRSEVSRGPGSCPVRGGLVSYDEWKGNERFFFGSLGESVVC